MTKAKQEPEIKPGIRIDGANRRDLNKERVAGRMAGVVKPPRPTAQIEADRRAQRKVDERAHRLTAKLQREDGGKEGTKLAKVKVKISAERSERQTIRCRPGTFDWRYGRDKQDALFHAGNHFARLWERAGTAAACSPSMDGASGAAWRGMPDGRVAAIDVLNAASFELGRMPLSRLIDYCVNGLTSAEIARKHGQKERDMAPVLHQDLRACAMHFLYL
ncbi:hypothetical protein [Mesorhizobium sp. A556]